MGRYSFVETIPTEFVSLRMYTLPVYILKLSRRKTIEIQWLTAFLRFWRLFLNTVPKLEEFRLSSSRNL